MKKLAYILKSSHFIYAVYYYVFSFLLRTLGLFVKTNDTLILFSSFGGKKFDDSPKAIYDAIKDDPRFSSFKLVWSIQNTKTAALPDNVYFVKTDTFAYFKTALAARVWITNSSVERGLSFKKKATFCLNTWHGTPIKHMGIDIAENNKSFRGKAGVRADCMLAQGQYDVDIFSHAFDLPQSKFRITGLPRNDDLANYTECDVQRIREKLRIPDDKIVLLYAPTFREFKRGKHHEVILNIPIDLRHWQEVLGEKYLILFRAHYEVARSMSLDGFSLFMDVSAYPNLNELMMVSDALLSDYSSIYFDYSIMHKPMYCFAYDYNEYISQRGMYIDLEKELPCKVHKDEAGILEDLLNAKKSYTICCQKATTFQQKYVTAYGEASHSVCEILSEKLLREI